MLPEKTQNNIPISGYLAVSYTHLDVYKRQVEKVDNVAVVVAQYLELDVMRFFHELLQIDRVVSKGGHGDVYKRQVPHHAGAGCLWFPRLLREEAPLHTKCPLRHREPSPTAPRTLSLIHI